MKCGIKLLENLLKIKKDSLERLKKILGEDSSQVISEQLEIETLEKSLEYLKEN